jgi:hypothetical protein
VEPKLGDDLGGPARDRIMHRDESRSRYACMEQARVVGFHDSAADDANSSAHSVPVAPWVRHPIRC